MSPGAGEFAPRAVVFDLDGTLVDSMPLVLRAVAYAISPFMTPPPPAEIYRRVAGPADRCLRELLGTDENVPVAVERLFAYAREHENEHEVVEGGLELIDALRARGVPLAIWTGRDRESATAILRTTGLATRFETIVFGDSLPTHKPDPEGLRRVAVELRVAPSELVLVGDAEVDVLGAHAAGSRSILIRQQREVSPEVRALAPTIVETPAEAFSLVRRWVGLPPA